MQGAQIKTNICFFYGISIFMGHVMANSRSAINPELEFIPSPGISPKVNVIARLKFKLVYYIVEVHYIGQDARGTSSIQIFVALFVNRRINRKLNSLTIYLSIYLSVLIRPHLSLFLSTHTLFIYLSIYLF